MNTDLLNRLLIICQHDFSKKADVFYSTSKDTIFVMDENKVITDIRLDNLNLVDEIREKEDKTENIVPTKKPIFEENVESVMEKNKLPLSKWLWSNFVWREDTTWRDCIKANLDPRKRILFSSVPSIRVTAEIQKRISQLNLLDAVVTEYDYLKEHKQVRVNFAAKKCYSRIQKNDVGISKHIPFSKFTKPSNEDTDQIKPQFV